MLPDFHSCFCKETSTCFSTARGSLLRETEEGRAYFKVNLVLSINEETSKTLWAVREATLIRLEPVATGCSWLGARWHPPEALQPIREGRLCALANQRSLRCCCWGKRWWELPEAQVENLRRCVEGGHCLVAVLEEPPLWGLRGIPWAECFACNASHMKRPARDLFGGLTSVVEKERLKLQWLNEYLENWSVPRHLSPTSFTNTTNTFSIRFHFFKTTIPSTFT